MHALIIEDDIIIARLIADALSDLGFSTFDFAHTADLAIMLAGAKTPDLITADVLLKSDPDWKRSKRYAHRRRFRLSF